MRTEAPILPLKNLQPMECTSGIAWQPSIWVFCAKPSTSSWTYIPSPVGAPIAQYVKVWSIDLALPGSRPAGSGNLFDSTAHSLSSSPSHRPDTTEILLART